MAKTEPTVTCDGCERDITYTGNCEGWRLRLHNERIPNPPGTHTVTLMSVPPVLFEGEVHFCGRKCLVEWANATA